MQILPHLKALRKNPHPSRRLDVLFNAFGKVYTAEFNVYKPLYFVFDHLTGVYFKVNSTYHSYTE